MSASGSCGMHCMASQLDCFTLSISSSTRRNLDIPLQDFVLSSPSLSAKICSVEG